MLIYSRSNEVLIFSNKTDNLRVDQIVDLSSLINLTSRLLYLVEIGYHTIVILGVNCISYIVILWCTLHTKVAPIINRFTQTLNTFPVMETTGGAQG